MYLLSWLAFSVHLQNQTIQEHHEKQKWGKKRVLHDSDLNHASTPTAIMHTWPCHSVQGGEGDTPNRKN